MSTLQSVIATVAFATALAGTPAPIQAQEAPRVRQYVYVLRVVPALHEQAKWTQADNDDVARQFMESDPAVVAGVMSATLHPYALALQRQP